MRALGAWGKVRAVRFPEEKPQAFTTSWKIRELQMSHLSINVSVLCQQLPMDLTVDVSFVEMTVGYCRYLSGSVAYVSSKRRCFVLNEALLREQNERWLILRSCCGLSA